MKHVAVSRYIDHIIHMNIFTFVLKTGPGWKQLCLKFLFLIPKIKQTEITVIMM